MNIHSFFLKWLLNFLIVFFFILSTGFIAIVNNLPSGYSQPVDTTSTNLSNNSGNSTDPQIALLPK